MKKLLYIHFLFLLIFVSCITNKGKSQCPVDLYSNYNMDRQYWKKVKKFKVDTNYQNGCELRFTNKKFVAKKVLSSNYSSLIFLLEDNSVLRLAKSWAQKNDLKDFYSIYKELEKNKVPVVKTSIDNYDESKIEYLKHDFLSIKFTLKEFFEERYSDEVFDEFLLFTKTLYPFVFIADLHLENIVYVEDFDNKLQNKWVAMDFGASDPDKFKDYPGKKFVYFEIDEEKKSFIKDLRTKKSDTSEFLTDLENNTEYPNLYLELSKNTITDPDSAIEHIMEIREELKYDIRKVIILERLKLL